ncbi:DUF916 and DUF3324 domain-containing protein [Lactiplantibacillus daowaiensis]|uniref:DUF916 and DUF3324 domain-containing protein n=1 Tax=Lactiplantibacillus daowaiensis TaxID=2559918 RepID=A0ABW1S2A4_9LACO|nr:DUF916 and DUF3324 domain-containing protein [Lactiplantibacillus daowaiensis]
MQRFKQQLIGLSVLIGLVAGLIGGNHTIQAAGTTQSNNIGFSVAAKIPKNQLNQKNSFFDLKMHSGQTQTLKTVIYNVTNRDIKVQTAIHTAYTNGNGVIEYVQPTQSFDSSLKFKMADLTKLSGSKTVVVPANGSKVVTAQVKIPKTTFNGVILGGWYFKRVNEKATSTVKKSMNITNEYSYVIGLKYTLGKVPAPTLQLTKVIAGMQNYHKGIFPVLRNPRAVIISNLNIKTKVTARNSGKTVVTNTKQHAQLAPNSTYKYPLLLGKTNLQAGKYHLHMVVKNSQHRWVFDRNFTINQAAAKKYNAASVDTSGINIIWFIVLGALGMLILVLLLLWLVLWLKRRRQQSQDQN